MLAFGPRPVMNAPQGVTRILYWEKWTGLEGQQMQAIVDEFNKTVGKEKGIYVDYVSMSQIEKKTLIATAAGVPPDVAGMWDSQVLQYASMNALEPLDFYAQEYGLTRDKFKPAFYDGCTYNGKLYAMPSTVYSAALIWNKKIYQSKATELRQAGLDPDRPPRTIAELDQYAKAIDTWEVDNGRKHLGVTGFIPTQPGSFTNQYPYWFGADIVSADGTKVELDTPQMTACYDWIRGYSERLGNDAISEFTSGFGQFDSPANPFMAGQNSMELMGPWIGQFIEKFTPWMNRYGVPEDQVQRENDFDKITIGMSLEDVQKLLGPGDSNLESIQTPPTEGKTLHWLGGVKDLYVTFVDGKVASRPGVYGGSDEPDKQYRWRPPEERKTHTLWGAAAFPSAVPGLENVAFAGMDILVIPSTSKHKKEAFEFIAFVLRQKEIEQLASQHGNLSPLKDVTPTFFRDHPNAYADVWDALGASPNARSLPKVINWPQLSDELGIVAQRSSLNLKDDTTKQILQSEQERCQKELNDALSVPENTNLAGASGGN